MAQEQAAVVDRKNEIVEVKVLRRWVGSSVNPGEKCGIPRHLAEALAALPENPACEILRSGAAVKETAGCGSDGVLGSDKASNHIETLIGLIGGLVEELKAARGLKAKN